MALKPIKIPKVIHRKHHPLMNTFWALMADALDCSVDTTKKRIVTFSHKGTNHDQLWS